LDIGHLLSARWEVRDEAVIVSTGTGEVNEEISRRAVFLFQGYVSKMVIIERERTCPNI
jgi:hypothetical protein